MSPFLKTHIFPFIYFTLAWLCLSQRTAGTEIVVVETTNAAYLAADSVAQELPSGRYFSMCKIGQAENFFGRIEDSVGIDDGDLNPTSLYVRLSLRAAVSTMWLRHTSILSFLV